MTLTSHQNPYGWLAPVNQSIRAGSSIFVSFDPGVAIVQIIFLAGLAAAALGVLGLPAGSGGPWTRRAGASVALAGILAAGTGAVLAGTVREEASGTVVPLLRSAASGRQIGYTPVCSHFRVPVCVHPAFRKLLPTIAAAVDPVTAQVAGLPGMPVRVTQFSSGGPSIAGPYSVDATISGSPPVLHLVPFPVPGQVPAAMFAQNLQFEAALAVTGFRGGDAGQAVAVGLVIAAGGRPGHADGARGQLYAVAHRFAALSPQARRAWLAAHLAALRAGRITLREVP